MTGFLLQFKRLTRHEWRLLMRDRTCAIVGTLLVVLVAGAVHNGATWARQQRATIAQIQDHDDRLYANLAEQLAALERRGNPWPRLNVAGMAWYLMQEDGDPPPAPHLDPRRPEAAGSEWVAARYAVLPPEPMAAVSIGQSDLHPFYARVTIRTKPAVLNNDEIENPLALLNGRFDLAFVLVFCWPLLALPLAYNLISEERESGTLRLVLSQPVSMRAVVLAKVCVRGGFLVTLTLAAVIVSLAFTGSVEMSQLPVLGVLCLLIAVTGLLWFGVACAVNVIGWRSSMNAMVLAGIWLGWVLVLPSATNLIISAVVPVPSRVELVTQMREATNAASGDVARLVAYYYEEHPEMAPPQATPDRTAVRSVTIQEEAERRVQPVLEAFEAHVARQQTIADRCRYLSPAMLLQDAMNELAGTTTGRYRCFMSQVTDYHAAWRAYFHPRIFAHVTLTAADYQQFPRFTYQPEPTTTVLRRALVSIAAVALLGLALLAAGLWTVDESSAT
jgi:ABC-2 type transport system permease protein